MKKIFALGAALLLLTGCEGILSSDPENAVNYDDRYGPYINIRMFEYTTTVGNPVDFSNVTGYDDVDGLMPVDVTGDISYDVPGDYTLVLSCSDTSGNETTVDVIVHVVETYQPSETPDTSQQEPQAAETGCKAYNAKDPERGCGDVMEEDAEKYDLLYQGEEWHQICINAAGDKGVCEAVHTNDGSFWGYGVIRVVETEEEKE